MQSIDFLTWLTAIEIPVMSGLFWLIWKNRTQNQNELQQIRDRLEARSAQFRENLAAFRIEVAKSYANNLNVRELEQRLISHLLRIESKLDSTALKTESINARTTQRK